MCLILDANRFGEALSTPPNQHYLPIIDWLTASDSTGMVIFGGTKFLQEIARSERARRWFIELQRVGRAKSIDRAVVDAEERALRTRGLCVSDDEHLVALARKSGTRVFCTEDAALFKDVRNPKLLSKPRGRVYRTKRHVALLCHNARCQRPTRRTR
jgi:predicted nucleic acid-binding protein